MYRKKERQYAIQKGDLKFVVSGHAEKMAGCFKKLGTQNFTELVRHKHFGVAEIVSSQAFNKDFGQRPMKLKLCAFIDFAQIHLRWWQSHSLRFACRG